MCIAIYAVLIGLLFFYSDFVISEYALAVTSAGNEVMVVALGWEMVPLLWPLLLGAMLLASALTVFVTRRVAAK